jgi:hypothetical protein
MEPFDGIDVPPAPSVLTLSFATGRPHTTQAGTGYYL